MLPTTLVRDQLVVAGKRGGATNIDEHRNVQPSGLEREPQ